MGQWVGLLQLERSTTSSSKMLTLSLLRIPRCNNVSLTKTLMLSETWSLPSWKLTDVDTGTPVKKILNDYRNFTLKLKIESRESKWPINWVVFCLYQQFYTSELHIARK